MRYEHVSEKVGQRRFRAKSTPNRWAGITLGYPTKRSVGRQKKYTRAMSISRSFGDKEEIPITHQRQNRFCFFRVQCVVGA